MKKKFGWLLSFLKIGGIGFGGGTSLIPVIQQEVVENRKLVTKEEYDSAVVAASITPGALPVQISSYIGKEAGGTLGMILAASCMAFPGVALTIIMLASMNSVDAEIIKQIELVSIGITAFIFAMMTRYIRGTVKWAREEELLPAVLAIIVTVVILNSGKAVSKILIHFGADMEPVESMSTVTILLMSFAIMAVCGLISARGHRIKPSLIFPKDLIREEVSWLLMLIICCIPAYFLLPDFMKYICNGFFSSVISFGGGDAYLTVADSLFIGKGMISESDFYGRLVILVNVLPGSVLCKTLSGVGYYMGLQWGGLPVALSVAFAGFICSIVGSCSVISLVRYLFSTLENVKVFQVLKTWVKTIISGLLITVMLSLLYQALLVGRTYGETGLAIIAELAVIYAVNLFIESRRGGSTWINVLVSIGLGLIAGNIIL